MELSFTKMTALGNDFIVVELPPEHFEQLIPRAKTLCNRRFGIGADGIIAILPGTSETDYSMRIINSDGSEPEMCGNGIRCFAHWLNLRGRFPETELCVHTTAGVKKITLEHDQYRVNMGIPQFDSTTEQSLVLGTEKPLFYTSVSMGNPHAVLYQEQLTDEHVLKTGPAIEGHPRFPHRTNVEFIRIINSQEIEMRVWERGCGETFACGTGACAAVAVGIRSQKHGNTVTVHLLGGDLTVSWSGEPNAPLFMTGPAEELFTGTMTLV